jgi:hypothetical protein
MLAEPARLEKIAVRLLKPVGGRYEWWTWSKTSRVGHLRVALTAEEYERVPPGCATTDAGESGPRRRRKK